MTTKEDRISGFLINKNFTNLKKNKGIKWRRVKNANCQPPSLSNL